MNYTMEPGDVIWRKLKIVPVLKPSVQMSKSHEKQSVWHEKHWRKWSGLNGGILPTLKIKVRFRAFL